MKALDSQIRKEGNIFNIRTKVFHIIRIFINYFSNMEQCQSKDFRVSET